MGNIWQWNCLLVVQLVLSLWKWENTSYVKAAVIPKRITQFFCWTPWIKAESRHFIHSFIAMSQNCCTIQILIDHTVCVCELLLAHNHGDSVSHCFCLPFLMLFCSCTILSFTDSAPVFTPAIYLFFALSVHDFVQHVQNLSGLPWTLPYVFVTMIKNNSSHHQCTRNGLGFTSLVLISFAYLLMFIL